MPANPQFPEIRRPAKCSEHFRHDTAAVLRQRGRFRTRHRPAQHRRSSPRRPRERRSTLKGQGELKPRSQGGEHLALSTSRWVKGCGRARTPGPADGLQALTTELRGRKACKSASRRVPGRGLAKRPSCADTARGAKIDAGAAAESEKRGGQRGHRGASGRGQGAHRPGPRQPRVADRRSRENRRCAARRSGPVGARPHHHAGLVVDRSGSPAWSLSSTDCAKPGKALR
jgi:hypothetical protein